MLNTHHIRAALTISLFLLCQKAWGQRFPAPEMPPKPAVIATDIRDLKLQLDEVQKQIKELRDLLVSERAALPSVQADHLHCRHKSIRR